MTTAEITNAIEGYPDTVLVNNNAGIKVHYAKDGKPVQGVSLVLSITPNDRNVNADGRYEIKGNASAVTDSDGNAVFTVGNVNAIKSNNVGAVASFNYSVKTVSDNVELANGELKFAAITVQPVEKSAPNNLTLSSNIGAGTGTNGVADTFNTRTMNTTRTNGHDVQYVYSQQVSKEGTTGNQVTFKGGVAQIVLPGKEAVAETKTQAVSFSTSKYHTYAGTEVAHYEKLEVNPAELEYATLNFKNIQISEHTRLVISAYTNETDAKNGSLNNRLNLNTTVASAAQVGTAPAGHSWDRVIDGPSAQSTFAYQIPLRDWNQNIPDVYFRVFVESAGRVNTDANAGFDWTNITYVYKSAARQKSEVYKDATIEWSKVDTTMSEPKTLNYNVTAEKNVIDLLEASNPGNVKLQGTKLNPDGTTTTIERVVYQVPVFPYTGNAVIKTYDKNNNVVDYYAYPTVNSRLLWDAATNPTAGTYISWDGDTTQANENKLPFVRNVGDPTGATVRRMPTSRTYTCYQISADEANNSVGTVTNAENNTVTVNSEKTGYTLLKGELKVNGQPISSVLKGFDDANSTVYTSVQWNPVRESTNHTGFIALKGQTITLIAQLTDQNGNPVAQSGLGVRFSQNGSTGNLAVGRRIGTTNATVVTNETVTDIHGQAKLVLNAGDVATVEGISAVPEANRQYRATVTVGTGNEKAESADLYWIDANLSFRSAVQGTDAATLAETATNNDIVTAPLAGQRPINPRSGEHWEYGVQVIGTSVPTSTGETKKLNGGVWNGKTVTIENLPVNITKGADSVGTVTPVNGRNGAADVTSTQRGNMDVINAILPQNLDANVKFRVSDVTDLQNNAGTGLTTINKRLTIRATWDINGQSISIFRAGGNNVAAADRTAAATPVYVRVTDAYGNYVNNKEVNVSVVNGSLDTTSPVLQNSNTRGSTATSGGAIVEATRLKTSTNGDITTFAGNPAAVEDGLIVLYVNAATATTPFTTITVTDVESKQSTAYTITWTTPAANVADQFRLNVNPSGDNGSVYVSRYDGNGKIILTFNQDIVADSVKDSAFKVKYGTNEYKIDSVTLTDRRQITLTASELGKTSVAVSTPVVVEVEPVSISGVTYVLTSIHGESIDRYPFGTKTTIKVYPAGQANVTLADGTTY